MAAAARRPPRGGGQARPGMRPAPEDRPAPGRVRRGPATSIALLCPTCLAGDTEEARAAGAARRESAHAPASGRARTREKRPTTVMVRRGQVGTARCSGCGTKLRIAGATRAPVDERPIRPVDPGPPDDRGGGPEDPGSQGQGRGRP